MKKCFWLLLICCIFLLSGCTNKNENVFLQIIELESYTNNEKVSEEISVKKGDTIKLEDKLFYECNRKTNNIKILNITNDYVEILRDQLLYDTNDAHKTSTKEVVEKIDYEKRFSTSINDPNPLAGECAQAKYGYVLQFIKK